MNKNILYYRRLTDKIRIIEVLQSIRLMFKNVNHIYKYTAALCDKQTRRTTCI